MNPKPSDLIAVGAIVAAHGVKGNLKIKPLTDDPERFKELQLVYVELKDDSVIQLHIKDIKINDGFILLAFDEVSDRNTAESLRGGLICITKQELLPLSDNEFYQFEVVGYDVKTTNGELLGKVEEILDLSANDVLVVKSREKEFLIPLIREVIKKINRERKEFVIEPIDGLLEL